MLLEIAICCVVGNGGIAGFVGMIFGFDNVFCHFGTRSSAFGPLNAAKIKCNENLILIL